MAAALEVLQGKERVVAHSLNPRIGARTTKLEHLPASHWGSPQRALAKLIAWCERLGKGPDQARHTCIGGDLAEGGFGYAWSGTDLASAQGPCGQKLHGVSCLAHGDLEFWHGCLQSKTGQLSLVWVTQNTLKRPARR